MDPRTGLGLFKDFRISNYQLMMDLIDYCKEREIEEILELPDVRERVALYLKHEALFKEQLKRCGSQRDNLVVLDMRYEDELHPGNRFVVYALFPDCNISMHVLWGQKRMNTVFAVGKSIFNQTSQTNVGELMLKYGGGGHQAAGTCQVDNDHAALVKRELIEKITADG